MSNLTFPQILRHGEYSTKESNYRLGKESKAILKIILVLGTLQTSCTFINRLEY